MSKLFLLTEKHTHVHPHTVSGIIYSHYFHESSYFLNEHNF